MCKQVKCKTCGLATWMGCGKHIAQVLNDVVEADRCGGWQKGVCDKLPPDEQVDALKKDSSSKTDHHEC